MELKQGEKEFGLLLELTRRPSLIISVASVMLLLASYKFVGGLNIFIIVALFEILAMFIAGWIAASKSLNFKMAVSAGAFTGFMIGMTIAFFKLLFFRQSWALINLIAEPIITAGVSAAVYVIPAKIIFKKK